MLQVADMLPAKTVPDREQRKRKHAERRTVNVWANDDSSSMAMEQVSVQSEKGKGKSAMVRVDSIYYD
jgi:hypothetical protein